MKNPKEAKFFCQCCGSEVPRKSKFCPKCGKFFASVLCPNCGHTGRTEDFVNGCPECGYAVDGSKASDNSKKEPDFFNAGNIKNNKKAGKVDKSKKITYKNNTLVKTKKSSDSSLPVWIYIFSIIILVILVICLYSCL